MNCLACAAPMTHRRCMCGGAWLSEARLVEKAQEIQGRLVTLPWARRDDGARRACPVCAQDMATVWLVQVALDRCPSHGVWFDAFELQTVLERAGDLPHASIPEPVAAPASDTSDTSDKLETAGGVLSFLGLIFDLLD